MKSPYANHYILKVVYCSNSLAKLRLAETYGLGGGVSVHALRGSWMRKTLEDVGIIVLKSGHFGLNVDLPPARHLLLVIQAGQAQGAEL